MCVQGVAAEAPSHAVEGYITEVDPPDGFAVNGKHVTTQPDTVYRLRGDKQGSGEGPSRDAVRVGAYVQVLGSSDKKARTVTAASVLFRDDWDKKLSGFGVIDKVFVAGAEPVYQADGYRIRITSSTDLSYGGNLKTLADVGTNTWVRYKGQRDAEGVLVAARAKFVPARGEDANGKAPHTKILPKQEAVPREGALLDVDGNLKSLHAKVRLGQAGGICGWHKVPADEALQERILRIGLRVVPAYQQQLSAEDPAKISFRFYAVDEREVRSDLFCNPGLILIPIQVVKRLQNDDQIAALLADGIAFHIQMQSAVLVAEYRGILGAEIVADALPVVPPAVLAGEVGSAVVSHEMEVKMGEQRGRIALALMADAGYDPRQAPEAWRLLAKKDLPRDMDSLKYPNRSWYQLGILNLQYSGTKAAAGPGAMPAGLR